MEVHIKMIKRVIECHMVKMIYLQWTKTIKRLCSIAAICGAFIFVYITEQDLIRMVLYV